MGKKLTYEHVKEQIEKEGYKLLSKEYINNSTKLELQCNKGHKYKATYGHFKNGNRCPVCAGNIKLTYVYIKEQIEKEGYKLLSTKYKNANTKLEIQCLEDHKYKVTYDHFKRGQRCPICAGNIKHTYEYVKKYINSFGYKLLSKEYINAHTKLKIQCPEGHKYKVTYHNFQQGHRCAECFGIKKLTYEQVKNYVESFPGYKLLSKEYINVKTKMKLQCPEGHKFEMTYSNFQQGQRCPQCYALKQSSKGEKEVCEYVKSLTSKPILENDRTQIINPLTGYNLELDIYIPSLKKAIEFNCDYWHSSPKSVAKDKEKIRQCKEKNIDLLVINYKNWKSCKEWCMELIKNFIEEN